MVKKILKKSSKKIPFRKIIKESKTSYKIPEYKDEKIFNDQNRFFKNEMEEAEISLFF